MRYQPQGRVRLSQPWQALGLENATLFQAADIETANTTGLSRVGAGHSVQVTRAGLGVSQNGGSNMWQTSAIGRLIGTGPQFAVMLTFQLNALGQTQKYLAIEGQSTRQAAVIYGFVANTVEFFSQGHSGTDPRAGSQIVINDLLPHTIIYTYDGAVFRGFLDGVEKFAVTKAFSINPNAGGALGAASSSANIANLTLLAHARFSRGLPRECARVLSGNPWRLFADPEEDDEFFLRAATGSSITVTPASLLLSGGEVAIRVSRRVGVQPAALAVTGGDISPHAARKLGVRSTSLTVSPGQVALKASRAIGVASAPLVLQPGEAGLRATRRLTVAPVEMTVTGGSIKFEYTPAAGGGNYVMAVSPAVLSLSGGNVGIRATRRMPVLATSLSLFAGEARLLAARRLLASPAGLAVMSGPALLRGSRRLQVEPAQMLVAGGSVTLRYSQQIEYARAPAGSGYSPRRVEVQSRPAQLGGSRPASIQRNDR